MKQIEFTCSLSGKPRPLPHVWEHTVGSGHAPLALRADWQRQLRRCHEQLGFRHVRFHNILSDDMGKPDLPTEREVEQLHVASEIVRELLPWICDAGTLHLEFTMPLHAIAAISVELPPQQPARKPGS